MDKIQTLRNYVIVILGENTEEAKKICSFFQLSFILACFSVIHFPQDCQKDDFLKSDQ